MAQTTQYLYEYQNGKRIRNLGFMKIEKQMDKCMIQIYAKNLDDIQGIIFRKGNDEKYIGGWEAEMLPVEEIKRDASAVEETTQDVPAQEKQEQPQCGTPVAEQHQCNMPAAEHPEEDTYIQPRDVIFKKIQRQDLSRLPRKEWRLANNSFLLHGFYNYHHLLYIEENGDIWIGVPGIYHEKEKMAAKSFGFSHFRRVVDVDVQLEEHETNTFEDFGYWCRQIPNTGDAQTY